MKISVFPEQETLRPSPIMNDEAEKSTGGEPMVEYIKKQSWNYPRYLYLSLPTAISNQNGVAYYILRTRWM